jgi:hypothetical protein
LASEDDTSLIVGERRGASGRLARGHEEDFVGTVVAFAQSKEQHGGTRGNAFVFDPGWTR